MTAYALVPPISGVGNFPNATGTGPLLELQTGPTDYALVSEISFTFPSNAFGSNSPLSIGWGTPAAKGVALSTRAGAGEDGGNTSSLSGITIITSWATLPTVPTIFLRRSVSNIGANGFSFQANARFPRGLKMLPSTSIVAWMTGGGGTTAQFVLCDVLVGLDS